MSQTSTPVYTHLDLLGVGEIRNVLLQRLATDPNTPNEARVYYNTVSKTVRVYTGTKWVDLASLDNELSDFALATRDVNLNGQRIINLGDPVDPTDAANKQYVDMARAGLDVKDSVRAATVGNIALTGTQIIDGVSLVINDRVLVKAQTDPAENGIWVVKSGAWVRAEDANEDVEITPGLFTFVEEGTANQDSGWVLTTDGPIVVGTTGLSFVQFSGAGQIIAGDALSKVGNRLDVNFDGATIVLNGNDELEVGLVPISKGGTGSTTAEGARANLNVPSRYSTTIGDGVAVSHSVTHGLNTEDVTVYLREASSKQKVIAGVTVIDANAVEITTLSPVPLNFLRVTVIG